MRWADIVRRLLGLAETVHRWAGALSDLEPEKRARVALFAEAIADTLAHAAEAFSEIYPDDSERADGARPRSGVAHQQRGARLPRPSDAKARRVALREIGRIHGYVSTIVDVLEHRLDGRRLAGVKRRLEKLDSGALQAFARETPEARQLRIDDLYAAEGYFRALADGLRV